MFTLLEVILNNKGDRNRQNNRGIGRQASKADRSRAAKGKTGGGFLF